MAKGIRVSRFSRIFSTQSALGRQPPEPKEPKKLKELAGPAESKPKTPTSPVVVPGKLKNTTPIGPRHDYKLFTLGVEELTVECAIDRADLPPGEMYQLPDCDCLICDTCLENAFRHGLEGEKYLCPAKCPSHSHRIPDALMEKCGKFTSQEVRRYKERVVELSTLDKRYCSNCGQFTPPSCMDNGGCLVCMSCGAGTCYGCKQPRHGGLCKGESEIYEGMKFCPRCKKGWVRVEGCSQSK
ncbi:MAG: hypothetical protein M1813_008846 [Trichoglossum hirsutum]|nr:MAG: hypothetical protein M1813_008846 [Trichoglossum hirsutum]